MNNHYFFSGARHWSLLVFCLLLTICTLEAQTSFSGAADNNWFNASNWTNGLPASGNDALIGGGRTVNIPSNLTVNFKITNFGTIQLSAVLLNNGTIDNSGSFVVNSGTMDNYAAFNNFGTFRVATGAFGKNRAGGQFNSNGTLDAQGTFNNAGAWMQGGTATIAGEGINSGAAQFNGTVTASGTFTNHAAG